MQAPRKPQNKRWHRPWPNFWRIGIVPASLILMLAACQPDDSPESVDAVAESAVTIENPADVSSVKPDSSWDQFVNRYIEDFLAAHPAFAVAKGRHEYDGQIPDWSAEGIAREIARLHLARDEALEFSATELGEMGQYQRDYLLAAIDRVLFWLEKAEWPFVNPIFYFDFLLDSLDPGPYIDLNYAPLEERMNSYTRYAGNIPRAVDQIRSNLRMPMVRDRLIWRFCRVFQERCSGGIRYRGE